MYVLYINQGCGSGSAWIRIHFPSWIRIRIQYADPHLKRFWIRIRIEMNSWIRIRKKKMRIHSPDINYHQGRVLAFHPQH